MSDYQMEVIAEPEHGSASVLVFGKNGPYSIIESDGSDNYLCGACRNVICRNVTRGQIINIVFKCPNCNAYNHLRGA